MRRFNSSLRQSFAVAMVLVALIVLLALLRASKRTPETSASSSEAHKAQALATPAVADLHGGWDLLWKDQRGDLLRTHCQIHQNGVALTLYVGDAKQLNTDARTPIRGIVETGTISFRIHTRDGDPIVFNGEIDNGILHGTTSGGFSWMAIRARK